MARREQEASAQWLLAQLQVGLAPTIGERGALEEKRVLIAKAARIAEPLFAIEPTHDAHARWMTILWRAQAELGPATEAPALFERILEVSRRRAQLEPRSTLVLRDLRVDLTATATWLADNGRDAAERGRAVTLCTEAVTVMEQRQRANDSSWMAPRTRMSRSLSFIAPRLPARSAIARWPSVSANPRSSCPVPSRLEPNRPCSPRTRARSPRA